MPERLAHRDLRNRSSEVLRAVAGGATYEITNHGEVVALLSPVRPEAGRTVVRRARIDGHWDEIEPTDGPATTAEVLEALRQDR